MAVVGGRGGVVVLGWLLKCFLRSSRLSVAEVQGFAELAELEARFGWLG